MPYLGYQTFKMVDATSTTGVQTYCCPRMVQNHVAGRDWINNTIIHFKLNANDMHGKPVVVQR